MKVYLSYISNMDNGHLTWTMDHTAAWDNNFLDSDWALTWSFFRCERPSSTAVRIFSMIFRKLPCQQSTVIILISGTMWTLSLWRATSWLPPSTVSLAHRQNLGCSTTEFQSLKRKLNQLNTIHSDIYLETRLTAFIEVGSRYPNISSSTSGWSSGISSSAIISPLSSPCKCTCEFLKMNILNKVLRGRAVYSIHHLNIQRVPDYSFDIL